MQVLIAADTGKFNSLCPTHRSDVTFFSTGVMYSVVFVVIKAVSVGGGVGDLKLYVFNKGGQC